MHPRSPAPATLAAVELIHAAILADNPSLALAMFEDNPPEERDRIAALIRDKLHRAVRIARTRRV